MSGYSQIRGSQLWYRLAQARVDANARNLFFFLLAPANERPVAGVRRFLPNEPLTFMPDWDQGTATEALSVLERAGLVAYDPDTALIFVPLLLEMQPYKGHPAVAGATSSLEDHPDSPVMIPALEHLIEAAREVAQAARAKAEGATQKQEAARRYAEQAEEMAGALEARLKRVLEMDGAPETPSRGYPTLCQEGPSPLRGGIEGVSGPHGERPSPPRGGIEGVSDPHEEWHSPPRGGIEGVSGPHGERHSPPRGGIEGVSRGAPRARGGACAPYPDPHPDPEPKLSGEDPPKRAPPFLGKQRAAKSGGKRGR